MMTSLKTLHLSGNVRFVVVKGNVAVKANLKERIAQRNEIQCKYVAIRVIIILFTMSCLFKIKDTL